MNRRYGNAQTIGCNINQNTYFLTKEMDGGFLVVMADGSVDSVTGAYGAILACETIAKGLISTERIGEQLDMQFARAAVTQNERLYRGKPPRVSVLAACFIGKQMVYKNVGDLSVAVFRNGELTIAEPPCGQMDIKGSITLLCNQGIWQSLTEIDLERLLSGRSHPYKKAQNMIEAVNRRNQKDQRCAVAVLVQ